jgi:hypothetical protein
MWYVAALTGCLQDMLMYPLLMRLAPLLIAAIAAIVAASTGVRAADAVEPGEETIARVLAKGFAPPKVAPPRGDEARGPFEKLLITNAILVDGTGAPPVGPVDIEVSRDRIAAIRAAGGHDGAGERADAEVIDAAGGYVLPGFIDAHAHLGTPSHAPAGALTDPEYVLKLWLAHGITTVRDPGAMMGLAWTLRHRELAEAGEISAPRMRVHAFFPPSTPSAEAARRWVRRCTGKAPTASSSSARGPRPSLRRWRRRSAWA